MKNLILIASLFLLVSPALTLAKSKSKNNGNIVIGKSNQAFCDDSDKGKQPNVAGFVLYQSGKPNCVKNEKTGKEICNIETITDRDHCVDDNTVLEFYCDDGFSRRIEIPCKAKEKCIRGACKAK